MPGPGYVADTDTSDDGALHAGVGLWALRDMVKRSAVLQHAAGKKRVSLMCKYLCDFLDLSHCQSR